MTYLRSFSRFVVVFLSLAGISAAAVPAGWIALRYDPPKGADQKGHWIIVKEPAAGLAAWWSDAELAQIVANDPDYVKRLETGWSPEDHPVADAAESELLAAELARYWDGDVPQMNFWAHGAMVRGGSTLEAFRWTQDGLTQRNKLEQAGQRPSIPAAAIDPDPVDQRYDNRSDIVTYGDRWGSHLRTETLDHVNQAERNKAQRRHHPNPPPSGEVTQKTKETVEVCRQASLNAEMGVFENYVRGWGGLPAKSATFGLPANCVADPGPLALAPPASPPPTPPKPVTPNPKPPKPPRPTRYTACDGSKHATRAAANAVSCVTQPESPPPSPPEPVTPPSPPEPETPEPERFQACDKTWHPTPAAAAAVDCSPSPPPPEPDNPIVEFNACDGSKHDTQAAADAVSCDPEYTACDGSTHNTQAEADAVDCSHQFQEQILHDLTCEGTFNGTTSQCDELTYNDLSYNP